MMTLPFQYNRSKLLIFCTLALMFLIVIPSSPSVKAAIPTLSIDPPSQTLAAPNTLVTFTVRVTAMDGFNAWDIMVNSTNTVLTPQSISIGSSVLKQYGTVNELTNCVNGGTGFPTNTPGNTGCDINDNPGIIHSAATLLGTIPPGPLNGPLFNITFKAVTGPGTAIIIFNDVLANGTRNPLVYSIQNGIYGNPPAGFFMNIKPTVPTNGNINIFAGGNFSMNVIVVAYGNSPFNVALNASFSPPASVTFTFNPKNLNLGLGQTGLSILTVSPSLSATPFSYNLNVTGKSGSISHYRTATIIVTPPQSVPNIRQFTSSSTSANIGDKITLTTTLANEGSIAGNMTMRLIWQGYLITNHTISLSPGATHTFIDTWDTNGFPPANSTVRAEIVQQVYRTVNFNLVGLPPTPFYFDPLFLGLVAIATITPSFLYVKSRSKRNKKR